MSHMYWFISKSLLVSAVRSGSKRGVTPLQSAEVKWVYNYKQPMSWPWPWKEPTHPVVLITNRKLTHIHTFYILTLLLLLLLLHCYYFCSELVECKDRKCHSHFLSRTACCTKCFAVFSPFYILSSKDVEVDLVFETFSVHKISTIWALQSV